MYYVNYENLLYDYTDCNQDSKYSIKYLNLSHDMHNLSGDSYRIIRLAEIENADFSYNNMSNFDAEMMAGSYDSLQSLVLQSNKFCVVPSTVAVFTNLRELNIGDNKITYIRISNPNIETLVASGIKNAHVLEQITNLESLRALFCGFNNIASVPPLSATLTNLYKLVINYNKLTEIDNTICNLVTLKQLHINSNYISHINKNISKLENLEILKCNNNYINDICSQVAQLYNLQEFITSNNQLTCIPICITRLRRLTVFHYYGNPIEHISPQVQRFLGVLEQSGNIQNVYMDSQNVHNSSIQMSILKSIESLMDRPSQMSEHEMMQFVCENSVIDENTKVILLEYINNSDIHAVLNINFKELFISVLSVIQAHEKKNEILRILNTEMQDSMCKCFTGRISRLVNVLNGFDDDVVVHISDSEQIGNIVTLFVNKYHDCEKAFVIEKIIDELTARGYEKDVISEWIEYI
jgi:Leucine-rich repeat (LRR) protein